MPGVFSGVDQPRADGLCLVGIGKAQGLKLLTDGMMNRLVGVLSQPRPSVTRRQVRKRAQSGIDKSVHDSAHFDSGQPDRSRTADDGQVKHTRMSRDTEKPIRIE